MSGLNWNRGVRGTLALSLWTVCLLNGCGDASNPSKPGAANKPGATPASTDDKSPKPRILFLTQSAGFKHDSVNRKKEGELSAAEIAISQLAQSSGAFTVACTQDAAADFTKENLQNYDIVWFYTTTRPPTPARDDKPAVPAVRLPIPEDVLTYFFKEWLVQKGHGFIGSHSASDTFHDYEPYWDMIGGTFNGHPWGSKETVTVTVHEPDHPVAFGWGPEFQIKDEIYQYKNWQPEKVRVIMSLDMAKCKTKMPYHVPVAWVKQFGEGRVYYNNLGHNPETWVNEKFQESLVHAIGWVSGKTPGSAAPNPEVSKAEEEKAKAAAPEAAIKKS